MGPIVSFRRSCARIRPKRACVQDVRCLACRGLCGDRAPPVLAQFPARLLLHCDQRRRVSMEDLAKIMGDSLPRFGASTRGSTERHLLPLFRRTSRAAGGMREEAGRDRGMNSDQILAKPVWSHFLHIEEIYTLPLPALVAADQMLDEIRQSRSVDPTSSDYAMWAQGASSGDPAGCWNVLAWPPR